MRPTLHRLQLRLIQELPLSPLLLILLVILLVTLLAEVPQQHSGSAVPSEQVIKLSIDAQRGLLLADQRLTLTELPAALSSQPAVLVQPHPDLPVQYLLEVMQALRKAGIQRTAVVTAP